MMAAQPKATGGGGRDASTGSRAWTRWTSHHPSPTPASTSTSRERRLGVMMAVQPKATGTRSQFVGPGIIGGSKSDPPMTLAQFGIDDKHLADRVRKYAAALPPKTPPSQ